MFEIGKTYTHRRMLDCMVRILWGSQYLDGKHELKIQWMNRRGMNLGFVEYISIEPKELENWYLYE